MNLSLLKPGQELFAKSKIDVLGVLKSHFGATSELGLETCINGSIYCLMTVPRLKEQARQIGLREMLEERLETCHNEQVII